MPCIIKLFHFFKKNKKIILIGIINLFLVFLLDFTLIISINFGSINVAEYFSSNLHLCSQNKFSNLIDISLESIEAHNNWAKHNYYALNDLSEKYNSKGYFSFPKTKSGITSFGLVNNDYKYIADNFHILCGEIEMDNYSPFTYNRNDKRCIISKSLALAKYGTDCELNEIIGKSLYICDELFIIDMVIEDSSLYNNFNLEEEYIISCYLNLIDTSEITFYKMHFEKKQKYDVFSLFKYMFYSNFFNAPLKSNENAIFLLTMSEQNMWLVNECESIYKGLTTDLTILVAICEFLYPLLGIFLYLIFKELKCDFSNNRLPCLCIIAIFYLGFYSLCSHILNGKYLLNQHLVGSPMLGVVYELLGLFMTIASFLLMMLFTKKKNDNIFHYEENKEDYYNVEV